MAEQIGRQRHRRAVEVAARDDLAVVGEHHRVVGGRVRLRSRRRARDEGEGVARRAVDLRRAAHRVGVLHAPAVGVRRVDARCRPAARRGCRADAVCPANGRAAWMRAIERLASIPAAPSMRQRRGDVGGIAPAARRRASASASRAVDGCVPLMSARPFLRRRARSARGRPRAAPRRRALAPSVLDASPSPISTSARWASGARSPLAPTDPRARHDADARRRLSSAMSASSVSTRMPENPFASTLARSAIVARTTRHGQRVADAGGVAAQQVDLQRAQRVVRDARRRRRCRSRC